MNDFKTMIAEALAAGEDITSIVNSFTDAANEAEKEFKDQKAKDHTTRPWAYGLQEMKADADKILDGTHTKQEAIELFAAVALKDAPARLRDSITRSDITSFVKSIDSAFNYFTKMTSVINDANVPDDDKFTKLIQEALAMFPTKPRKTHSIDDDDFLEFIKNL